MYNINDHIVYGKMGVCKVMDIKTRQNGGAGQSERYYVLEPLSDNCTIYIPVASKVYMRPVVSAKEADRLIETIPSIQAEACYSDRMQELTQRYETSVRSGNPGDLIWLTMSIYNKKQAFEQRHQKFGLIDERYMKLAEQLLYSEFSLALGIPAEGVPEYIAARVKALKARRKPIG